MLTRGTQTQLKHELEELEREAVGQLHEQVNRMIAVGKIIAHQLLCVSAYVAQILLAFVLDICNCWPRLNRRVSDDEGVSAGFPLSSNRL